MKIIDVIYVDEVAPLLARPVNDRRFAFQKSDDEGAHDRRNGTPIILYRSVDAEIAQGGEIQAIKPAIEASAKYLAAILLTA